MSKPTSLPHRTLLIGLLLVVLLAVVGMVYARPLPLIAVQPQLENLPTTQQIQVGDARSILDFTLNKAKDIQPFIDFFQGLSIRRRFSPRASSLAFDKINSNYHLSFRLEGGSSLAIRLLEDESLGWLVAVLDKNSNDAC